MVLTQNQMFQNILTHLNLNNVKEILKIYYILKKVTIFCRDVSKINDINNVFNEIFFNMYSVPLDFFLFYGKLNMCGIIRAACYGSGWYICIETFEDCSNVGMVSSCSQSVGGQVNGSHGLADLARS